MLSEERGKQNKARVNATGMQHVAVPTPIRLGSKNDDVSFGRDNPGFSRKFSIYVSFTNTGIMEIDGKKYQNQFFLSFTKCSSRF